jgi:AcrR family transcriptional regulator
VRGEVRHALRERQILEVATGLLRERGYVAVSMEDVAKASGVGKATLYKHFASKDDLVVAVILAQMARGDEVYRAMPADLPALDRLERMIVDGIEKRSRYAPIPVGQVPPSVEGHPRLVAELQRMQQRFEGLLEEARAAGELLDGVPSNVIAAHLMATFGKGLDATAQRLGVPPESLARQLATIVFQGLRAR